MCGRYMMTSPVDSLCTSFGVSSTLNLRARYNIAPGQPIPIILPDDRAAKVLVYAEWGLIPDWMKARPSNRPMINARAETLSEKPSFRGAYRHHRCLIPANGYYEWTSADGRKTPMLIAPKDAGLMAFAGLYTEWAGPGGDNALMTAAIVTTEASGAVAEVHHRMPVMLDPMSYADWLDVSAGTYPDMNEFKTLEVDTLIIQPVSRRLGNVKHDDESVLSPDDETPDQGSLF